MLKGLDPLLGPDLLQILRAMGHGDDIAVVDANFPAAASALRLVRVDAAPAPRIVQAILSVLPLDTFVPHAAFRMAVVDRPDEVPPITREFECLLEAVGYRAGIEPVERFGFYELAKQAYAIVATGERRLYGNLILRKGVLPPEDASS